jgi:hypothetical protein
MPITLPLASALHASPASPACEHAKLAPRTNSIQSTPEIQSTVQAHTRQKEIAQMNNYESFQTAAHESIQAIGPTQPAPHSRAHAEATVTVHDSQSSPFDPGAGPVRSELRLSETFAGDIDGQSSVRAFEVRSGKKHANLISMQRFIGKLGDRKGTFLLQGSEIVENGSIKATWFVVPGSGTGELSGLRGEGGFAGEFGKGSHATLDYWFE